jgi:molybdenum cofactor cytidylyltransferase
VAELLWRRAAAGAPLAVPTFQGKRGHPLAIAPDLLPEIETLDPAIGLKQILERHAGAVLEVPVDDPGAVRDVDTPEDYQQLSPDS